MNSNYYIEQLLEKEENLWIEFKRQWYWNNDETDPSSGWTEFMIDFSALFNTYDDNGNPLDISIILLNHKRCYNLRNQIGVNYD